MGTVRGFTRWTTSSGAQGSCIPERDASHATTASETLDEVRALEGNPPAPPGVFPRTDAVKGFNDTKGYGFITPDDGSEEVFAHLSSIQMNGFKSLRDGQKVEFKVVQGPKGKQASAIQNA